MKQLKELLTLLEKQKKTNSPARAGSKALNDVLRTKRSGGHFSDKSDYKRAKEKEKARKDLVEAEGETESEMQYFKYTLWYERKDYGNGDGGDRSVDGIAKGKTSAEVQNRLKRSYPRTYRVDLKPISKEDYEKRMRADD